MEDLSNERTPSFTINPTTDRYNCHACNAVGDVISFICKQEDRIFREAYERLSKNGINQPSANRPKTKANKSCTLHPLLLHSL